MSMTARYLQRGESIDYVPGSDVAARKQKLKAVRLPTASN